MRILFWSETFWPRVGGVENLAAKLLPALRDRGHEFAVVSWGTPDLPREELYGDIPVYRFPFFPGFRTGNLDPLTDIAAQVTKLKRDFGPDLVHVNSYGGSVLFHLMTATACPAPMLVTLHQALPNEPVRHETLLGKVLRSADWVTTCSKAVLEQTRELLPEISSRTSVIYNALELPDASAVPLRFDAPRLLCLGRLVQNKGFDLALEAFAQVLNRFPQARLIVAGDGSERKTLERQTNELGLAQSVEFLGTVSPEKVPQLINESTLVLIPSRLEGFSLVALEAAWMGRPVVAARIGGLPEVVAHEETGLLTEVDDCAAFARAIMSLLQQPEIARQMGRAARRRAQELFSWDRHVDAYDELYRKLTAGTREGASIHAQSTNRLSR
jgi:glycogen(starch) synthase